MDADVPIQAAYDETPYRDQVFAEFDLARLLGYARLFGLASPDVETGSLHVLDLACSSGAHLREQAARYPGVRFTGVDFSRSEIEAGRKAIYESGLENVELQLVDLRHFEAPGETYDIILCHGAFSWVPDEVKDRIFQLCRTGLKRNGLAVVAYLTYPGWKQREAIRELLAFRVRDVEKPAERVRESALMLRLLHAGYTAQKESATARSLKSVVEGMQRSSANVFVHDELGSIHDPCYFVQFVEWASEWGLQYLAESDLGTMALEGLPDSALPLLQELAPDFLETQQLIDFLVNRSGRTSVLVRDDAQIARELAVEELAALEFTTRLAETEMRHLAKGPAIFETSRGARFSLEDPCMLALVRLMLDAGPEPIAYSDLAKRAVEAGYERADFDRALLTLIGKGWAEPSQAIG